jgi:hypothetical protein
MKEGGFLGCAQVSSFAALRMTEEKRLPSWTGGVDSDRAKRRSEDGVVEILRFAQDDRAVPRPWLYKTKKPHTRWGNMLSGNCYVIGFIASDCLFCFSDD